MLERLALGFPVAASDCSTCACRYTRQHPPLQRRRTAPGSIATPWIGRRRQP
jgi:hypothetical protein